MPSPKKKPRRAKSASTTKKKSRREKQVSPPPIVCPACGGPAVLIDDAAILCLASPICLGRKQEVPSHLAGMVPRFAGRPATDATDAIATKTLAIRVQEIVDAIRVINAFALNPASHVPPVEAFHSLAGLVPTAEAAWRRDGDRFTKRVVEVVRLGNLRSQNYAESDDVAWAVIEWGRKILESANRWEGKPWAEAVGWPNGRLYDPWTYAVGESIDRIQTWLDEQQRVTVHSDDFRSVNWFGEPYDFTLTQARCVETLWDHWERGTPVVSIAYIQTETECGRIDDVFRGHPAFGQMIARGPKGTLQLKSPAVK